MSLWDAAYYATVTLSTTGYGDIVPITELARITNIFVITPLRFIFLIVLVGTTIEVLTRRTAMSGARAIGGRKCPTGLS